LKHRSALIFTPNADTALFPYDYTHTANNETT